MAVTTAQARNAPTEAGPHARSRDHLSHVVEHAAHLLPAQGPITVFIHHNTLHAFEDMPFHQAVQEGARVFGCQPYLSEDRFRAELARGRIRFEELRHVLEEDLRDRAGEKVVRLGTTRLDLRLAMLQYPMRVGPAEELRWFIAETNALRRFRPMTSAIVRGRTIAETRRWVMRDLRGSYEAARRGAGQSRLAGPAWLAEVFDRFHESSIEAWDHPTWEAFTLRALWRVCCEGARGVPPVTPPAPPAVRHRDLLMRAAGADTDAWVHPQLIRACAAFVDQGIAHWALPDRERGFFKAFCTLYRRPGGPPDRWLRGLARELARLDDAAVAPLESARESLELLGVPEREWDEFVSATLLALRGWGGILRQLEVRGDRVAHPAPAGTLVEFLAVRLVLERFALAHAARESLGYRGPLAGLRDAARARVPAAQPPGVERRAFPVFHLAQVLGWTPEELYHLPPEEWAHLLAEVEAFGGVERRRVFYLAYERRFLVQTLDAVVARAGKGPQRPASPKFQVVTCIDEREESFRRHLEELAPEAETFGTAGFYGVAMYYRGAADAHYIPLCPVVVRPQHWVEEQVVEELDSEHRRRAQIRRLIGAVSHRVHVTTRTFAAGAVLTAGVGVFASIPLIARILYPRLAARARRLFGRLVTPPKTRLKLERAVEEAGEQGRGGAGEKDLSPLLPQRLGYSPEERTAIGERVLRDIGLTGGFARLVLMLGHGSHSMNNPHESAHDCGACGGSVGGPNGRAIAQILNDPEVREGLAARGLKIPDDTVFVGGLHNTCNEYVKFYDKDRIPASHLDEFHEAEAVIDQALARNAHERARRFESAPLTLSFEDARRHMDARAEDLAQVRPEWGHATNAVCVVGRRERTRGLFLDRRAFLVSYDPTQDDADATILTRTLQAVVPVCAGINLEYYFCHTDPSGWGCGTKLPHNITSLLGVMDGAASDLRTGLPWQMVEIHEPVRLVFVVEAAPETLLRIMDRNPGIGQLVRNGWVHLACLDPGSAAVKVFEGDRFRERLYHFLEGKQSASTDIRVFEGDWFSDYRPQHSHLPRAESSIDWYRGWRDHLEFAEIGH